MRKGRTSPSEQKAKRTGAEKSPRLEAKGSTATAGSQATETEEELEAQQRLKQGLEEGILTFQLIWNVVKMKARSKQAKTKSICCNLMSNTPIQNSVHVPLLALK